MRDVDEELEFGLVYLFGLQPLHLLAFLKFAVAHHPEDHNPYHTKDYKIHQIDPAGGIPWPSDIQYDSLFVRQHAVVHRAYVKLMLART